MKVVNSVKELRDAVKSWKREGLKVGLVPTMGYLHEGHKSLIDRAVKENDKVVVSIFVNPIQFGPKEDLATYPRDMERDSTLCLDAGVDIIFHPEKEEMYEEDFCTSIVMKGLTENLCGKTRPVHFGGVCTVITKLLNIVSPDKIYFGQKDAQQLAVVRRMVRDFNFDVEVVGCPIIREEDGLAKSSRNTYLNEEERKAATILNESLKIGHQALEAGERESKKIIDIIKNNLNTEKLAKVEYVQVVDNLSMTDVEHVSGEVLVAIAVYIGKTRLIDNFIFEA